MIAARLKGHPEMQPTGGPQIGESHSTAVATKGSDDPLCGTPIRGGTYGERHMLRTFRLFLRQFAWARHHRQEACNKLSYNFLVGGDPVNDGVVWPTPANRFMCMSIWQATEGCCHVKLVVQSDGPEIRADGDTVHECLADAC